MEPINDPKKLLIFADTSVHFWQKIKTFVDRKLNDLKVMLALGETALNNSISSFCFAIEYRSFHMKKSVGLESRLVLGTQREYFYSLYQPLLPLTPKSKKS